MALCAGSLLGQYEISSSLGAGGMGEVYRAYDTRLDREVAIKVLPENLITDATRLRRFEQEARATAALNHPNIVAVYQMATENGFSYIVSELLHGETLRDRLQLGPIPVRKAIDYATQIAHGLAAAHKSGVIHRDLKPANLFITTDGPIKILDFGLARLTVPAHTPHPADTTSPRPTEPGVVLGTVGYMAPEQVRGETADHRSDIFAFGAVLYEMLTGNQAFHKPSSAETMAAILHEDPPPIPPLGPTAPPGLQRIIDHCLEKNPDLRFQSASDLAFALEPFGDDTVTSKSSALPGLTGQPTLQKSAILAVGLLLFISAVALAYSWTKPSPGPVVSKYVQLTRDGLPKTLGATDGSRIYLSLLGSGFEEQGIAAISISGGEPKKLSILPSPDMSPRAISRDGSELLVVDGHGTPARGPFWTVPLLGGSPRRLGDTAGQDAAWSPDGKLLAFSSGRDLFISRADGTDSHKILSVAESRLIFNPVWSPDASHLRLNLTNIGAFTSSIWEVGVDGAGLHPILPNWHHPPDECCGSWTADGKYFIFLSQNQIWVLPRRPSLFHAEPRPIQLTSSPMALQTPIVSRDGTRIFAIGATTRGELMRYDLNSHQFTPYLLGISAEYLDFSRDGQWVVYVSYPDGIVWRSRLDGSQRLQLSNPPGYAMLPRWSPDGKQIVFSAAIENSPSKLYVVSPDGESPRELLPDDPHPQREPSWSPDGTKIVFAGYSGDAGSSIRVLDLSTSITSTLPQSKGLFSPRWSPDGRYIAALTSDQRGIQLFDVVSQQWTLLATGTFGWLNWSHDSRYLMVLDGSGSGAVLKLDIHDGNSHRLIDLTNFTTTGRHGGALAITPDDSPLLLRNSGTYDVYAIDWQAH